MPPRVFIIRHGETDWSLTGRHTSITNLPLTPHGRTRIAATARALIGADRLIDPSQLAQIYVSPRSRAQETLGLLMPELVGCANKVTVTENLREWEYGDYEGLTSKEIRASRAERGVGEVGKKWDIWADGCEGGEMPEEVERRCDEIVKEIRERWHGGNGGEEKGDVVCVAHGHLLRALTMRWIGRGVGEGVPLVLEAGGVGCLGYEHGSIEEPAIVLGGGFCVA